MRTPVLTRRLTALFVGVGITTSLLSVQASAEEPATMSAAALPRIGELDAYGEADWQRLAQEACNAPGATPEVESVTYAQSGGNVETLLISAAVDRVGDQDFDDVCTFAVIATRADTGETYGNYLSDGMWRLQAGASGTSGYTAFEGRILGNPTVVTRAIFTDVELPATAELTATGNHVTSKATTVTVPGRAKTPAEVKRAKVGRDRGIKAVKKNYSLAKKKASTINNPKKRSAAKAKAKKAYKRALKRTHALYARQLLPTPARTHPGKTTVRTPFSLRLSIDD